MLCVVGKGFCNKRFVKEVNLEIQLGSGKKGGGVLFMDDLVGVGRSKKGLQKCIIGRSGD